MAGKTKEVTTKILIGVIVAVTIAASGLAIVLAHNTLIAWWWPVMICALPAWIAGLMLNDVTARVTGVSRRIVNCLIGAVVAFGILICAFYSVNFYASDAASATTFDSEVVNKHVEERYRTKRLSRNRSVRGEKYNAYCVVVRLPQSRTRQFEVSAGQYTKVRKGQKLKLQVEKGFLGIPVVKNMSLPPLVPDTLHRKRHRGVRLRSH